MNFKTILFTLTISLSILLIARLEAQKNIQRHSTTFKVVKKNDQYFIGNKHDAIVFPIGLNHLNIHELQKEVNDLQKLNEDELNEVLYHYLVEWGFNCSGYDRVHTLNKNHNILHYVKTEILSLASYHGEPVYRDVFDRSTYKFFKKKMKSLAEYNEDPNVIGLMYSDLPRYFPTEKLNWITFYRNLPVNAPGKIKYIDFLTKKYQHNIVEFNKTYNENITNTSELKTVTFTKTDSSSKAMLEDDVAFLSVVYRKYIESIYELHQKYAPNLMFLGDVFGKQKEWSDDLIKIAGEYCDIISFQPSDNELDTALCHKIYELSGKPVIIADQKVSFKEAGYKNIQGEEVETEEQAALGYENYVKACFGSPIIVGYNRCMFI
ncbi:MAG: hypothetical protein AAGI07_15540 [Bacteroidota bacterium]